MTIKNLIEKVTISLIDYCRKKFTGKLTLEIDLKDGGIGNCNLITKQSDPNFKRAVVKSNCKKVRFPVIGIDIGSKLDDGMM